MRSFAFLSLVSIAFAGLASATLIAERQSDTAAAADPIVKSASQIKYDACAQHYGKHSDECYELAGSLNEHVNMD